LLSAAKQRSVLLRIAALLAFLSAVAGCSRFGTSSALPQTPIRTWAVHGDTGFKTIFAFNGTDGDGPLGAPIVLNGVLYGTTEGGGAHNDGVVYSLTATGKERVIHSFYHDGFGPVGSVIAVQSVLYGMTNGGKYDDGTIFAIKTDGHELWTYDFKGGWDGRDPVGGLIRLNDTLYGTTSNGGNYYDNDGSVFKVTRSGRETELYAFSSSPDGATPTGNLVFLNGVFYGTTSSGGQDNGLCGTIFNVTKTGTEKVVYAFKCLSQDGASPQAGLAALNVTLYGTTAEGGKNQAGTVFSITAAGKERVIHSFGATGDGVSPQAPLVVYKGSLYGTTAYGGTNNDGTVFKVSASGKELVLHSFTGANDGSRPLTGLVALNGLLYGTTWYGPSASGYGTVFSLTP
jgi:uncharacterized repeat protein (TIGR03803 family)